MFRNISHVTWFPEDFEGGVRVVGQVGVLVQVLGCAEECVLLRGEERADGVLTDGAEAGAWRGSHTRGEEPRG